MIRIKIFQLLMIFLLVSCSPSTKAEDVEKVKEEIFSDFTGEAIHYVIKKIGISAGEAVLTFHGATKLGPEDVYLISFRAEGFNFLDEEKIYVDRHSFLPIQVERDLNIFGKKEKITEYYDSSKGIVRVVKVVGEKTTEQIIEKEGEIDNIYCFIYRYRRDGGFAMGDSLEVHLPTKDIVIELMKQEKVKAADKVYEAYRMQSNPKKYTIWFDDSTDKIPLRIDGAAGFGNTAMIMTEYQEESPDLVINE